MKYKERLIDVSRHYLLKTHTSEEVDKMLGNWNDSAYKTQRNKHIEESLAQIKKVIDQHFGE